MVGFGELGQNEHIVYLAMQTWYDYRISVELILSLLVQDETPETILEDYPALESEDIRACLAYAHAIVAHDVLDAVQVESK